VHSSSEEYADDIDRRLQDYYHNVANQPPKPITCIYTGFTDRACEIHGIGYISSPSPARVSSSSSDRSVSRSRSVSLDLETGSVTRTRSRSGSESGSEIWFF
jgi:hypothetical protein